MNIRKISPELALKARNELHEVESRIPEDLAHIRDWIEKQPHLKSRTDDQFLLAFLRGCKYSLEKTKSKIDLYYTIKTISPQLFLNKQIDSKTMKLAKLGPFLPLLEPIGADGPRIHVIRYAQINFDEFNAEDLFKMQLRVLDIQMFEDDNVFIGGFTIVTDMASLPLSTILKFDFVLINKLAIFCEKAVPVRVKGVHLVNMCKEALYICNAVKSFLPKTIKNRFMIHSSMESVYEHIPKKYLPTDYGGENGSLEDTKIYWENMFLRYKEFFEDDVNYGVNEKLRIGEKRSSESIFGLEGSFRKLEVD